jgi:two-component system OmpR family response regulator
MTDVLVVDDDPNLREVVRYALAREGWTVREATNGVEALQSLAESPVDIVVLDVTMPEMDGLEACRRLRMTSDVPVVFLSSRAEEIDRILGLELGGDDYIAKPFSPRELVSRVKAILRRARPTQPAGAASNELIRGSIRVDTDAHRAWVGDSELDLTGTELKLLAALIRNSGRLLSRSALVRDAYGGPHCVSDRTVDSHVRNIRAKLREHNADPIETVHGAGFRLT